MELPEYCDFDAETCTEALLQRELYMSILREGKLKEVLGRVDNWGKMQTAEDYPDSIAILVSDALKDKFY